jgi:hypothetical protein
MYAEGHRLVTGSLENVLSLAREIFNSTAEIILGVTPDSILAGTRALERNNSTHAALAGALHGLGIITITLRRGLTGRDIMELIRILSLKPSDVLRTRTVSQLLTRAKVSHITVETINPGHLHITDEEKIGRADLKKENPPDEGMWETFVASLLAKSSGPEGAGSQGGRWEKLIGDYNDLVHSSLLRMEEDGPSPPYGTLANVNNLIMNLPAELRTSLLSTLCRNLSTTNLPPPILKQYVDSLPRELAVEALRLSNVGNLDVNPALLHLFRIISTPGSQPEAEGAAEPQSTPSRKVGELLDHKGHSKYVPDDYDDVLQDMVARDPDPDREFSIEPHLESLKEEYLDLRINRMLLALIDGEVTEEDYRYFLQTLAGSLSRLLAEGNFTFLLSVVKTLRRHEALRPSEIERSLAGSALDFFSDTEAVSNALIPLLLKADAESPWPDAGTFLVSCGPQHVGWLMDLYCDAGPVGETLIRPILILFGDRSVAEAAKRLSDPKPEHVRRMIQFIRASCGPSCIPYLKHLVSHEDAGVRQDITRTLLEFGDPAGMVLVRQALSSGNSDMFAQAVMLAAEYRLVDIMVRTLSMVATFYISASALRRNEFILTQIAGAGEPVLIPHLERIYSKRFTLSPGRLYETKLALIESLSSYPEESVRPLLLKWSLPSIPGIRAMSSKPAGG